MVRLEISVMPPLMGSPSIGRTNIRNILEFAELADEEGLSAILLQDHIGIPDTEAYDCLTTLAVIASRTRRIRLGTLATPIPLRHPALLAKEVSNIDIISGGRMMFTAGAGWARGDFERYGFPYERFETRVRMMKEGIQVMKQLWTKSPANYKGEFYNLVDADLQPKPVQRPHPPVWVAGISEEALGVAVDEGTGWFGWLDIQPKDFASKVALVDKLCEERGRPRDQVQNGMHIQASIAPDERQLKKQAARWMEMRGQRNPMDRISYGTPEDYVRLIEEYANAGVNHLNVVFVPVDTAPRQLQIFADEVLPRFR